MSEVAPKKICQVCGKDVSASKRVRDSHGRYYCAACNDAAMKRAQSAGPAKASAAASKASPAAPTAAMLSPPNLASPPDDDTYDLLPSAPDTRLGNKPAPRPAAKAPDVESETTAPAKPLNLPKFCPNCDAPVLPNRRFCIKCNRDLTRMDKLIAMKAEAARGPSREEVVANWISRGIKAAVILVCIGVVVFLGLGLWTMLHGGGAFDEFPTKRAQVVNDFLARIAKGEYEKAFYLVSFRERTTNNENEIENYKRLFAKMHDELAKKHGDGWISRVKVEPVGDPNEPGEDAVLLVKIDNATYHATTQVQISLDQAIANRTSRHQPTYLENGKNHFGMVEVWEYALKNRHGDLPDVEPDKGDNAPE